MVTDPSAQVTIKVVQSASRQELIQLYKAAGWWEPSFDDHPEFLDTIVKDSAVFVGAFYQKSLIGMGRALSDMSSDAYIQDVVVLEAYRGSGIGEKIVRLLLSTLQKSRVDWIGVVAQPGTVSFYKKLGFDILKDHTPLKYNR